MARYAAEHARVTLVTCTMGERGINRLAPGRGSAGGQLGALRARELKAACAALGVRDHRFLGGPGRWRDSGPGTRSNDPHCFRLANVDEAAGELAEVVREVRPQVMVTYDAYGFYGHPDHVQAHKVAWRAYTLACDRARTKFYALTIPRSVLAAAVLGTPWSAGRKSLPSADAPTLGIPDEQVTTEISAQAHLEAKLAALAAHATQIAVDGPFFLAAGLRGLRALGTEYYTLLAGPRAAKPAPGDHGREDDLFSGVS
jgi:N-acetyl-1-D-myo-inositol-2-amino-2-deoxy-alpha-D-glucopyranoside deacetylase